MREPEFRKPKIRGTSVIEFTLMLPWYIFLFVGVFDYGIYCCSLIAAENAARVGATYCSTNSTDATDSTTACTYALDQLRNLPNVGSGVVACNGSPITVTASLVRGPDNVANDASTVTVTYTTPQMVPIPGLFPGQLTINRSVTMRLRG